MKSVLKYIGMKNIRLSNYGFDENNHKIYCEPFSGSFNTGFRLYDSGYNGKLVYNDLDSRVVNFWEQLREDDVALREKIFEINNILNSVTDDEKADILNKISEEDNKVTQAACEFLSRQYLTIRGNVWSTDRLRIDEFDFYLTSMSLKNIEVNNTDYEEMFDKYDSENTFFLIDPPYDVHKVNMYYRGEYREFNHEALAEKIKSLKGDWLLTYNDNLRIRRIYKDYPHQLVGRRIANVLYNELYITKNKLTEEDIWKD